MAGQGTITMVRQGKRRNFRITTGDTVRILAGTTVHLINSHKKQKLRIAYFMLTVGVPGRFEVIILLVSHLNFFSHWKPISL